MRRRISAALLSVLARVRGSVRARSLGSVRTIPLRGPQALFLLQRGFRDASWKTAFFEAFAFDEDACFVDVGANFGSTLLEYKSVHPLGRYLGFEPNPPAIAYVNELIALNGYANCQTYAFAASDRAGPAILTIDPDDPGSAGASLIAQDAAGARLIRTGVATLPLDSVLPAIAARVRLLKIDVEGAELQALRGMAELLARDRPVVMCEVLYRRAGDDVDPTAQRNAAILAFLRERHYRIFQIVKTREDYGPIILREIEAFGIAVLDERLLDLCDYVFCPAETAPMFPVTSGPSLA